MLIKLWPKVVFNKGILRVVYCLRGPRIISEENGIVKDVMLLALCSQCICQMTAYVLGYFKMAF